MMWHPFKKLWFHLNGGNGVILTSGRACEIVGGLWRDIQDQWPDPRYNAILGDPSYGREEILDTTTEFWRQLIADCGHEQSGITRLPNVPQEALSQLTARELAILTRISPATVLSVAARDLAEDLDAVWCEMYQMRGDNRDYSLAARHTKLGIP